MEKKNTIDISRFFTKKNEEEGITRELFVSGLPTGIMACIYGVNSNAAAVANETYKKEMAEISSISDPVKKGEKADLAFAKRVAGFIKNLSAEDGKSLTNKDGSIVTEKDYPTIMLESPLLARAVLEYATETEYFLDRGKNA